MASSGSPLNRLIVLTLVGVAYWTFQLLDAPTEGITHERATPALSAPDPGVVEVAVVESTATQSVENHPLPLDPELEAVLAHLAEGAVPVGTRVAELVELHRDRPNALRIALTDHLLLRPVDAPALLPVLARETDPLIHFAGARALARHLDDRPLRLAYLAHLVELPPALEAAALPALIGRREHEVRDYLLEAWTRSGEPHVQGHAGVLLAPMIRGLAPGPRRAATDDARTLLRTTKDLVVLDAAAAVLGQTDAPAADLALLERRLLRAASEEEVFVVARGLALAGIEPQRLAGVVHQLAQDPSAPRSSRTGAREFLERMKLERY